MPGTVLWGCSEQGRSGTSSLLLWRLRPRAVPGKERSPRQTCGESGSGRCGWCVGSTEEPRSAWSRVSRAQRGGVKVEKVEGGGEKGGPGSQRFISRGPGLGAEERCGPRILGALLCGGLLGGPESEPPHHGAVNVTRRPPSVHARQPDSERCPVA